MLNEIKNLFKRLFGLVDTNHDGKVSAQEAQAAAFNAQAITTTAEADIKATTEVVTKQAKERVKKVKEEVKSSVDHAEDVLVAVTIKGGARRGRKPKA
jgi:methionyl-tRNA synthetase